MSRYKSGDVLKVEIAYYNRVSGKYESKVRPFVVLDVVDGTDNISVKGTGQTHKSANYTGITVLVDSDDGIDMGIDIDTFFYCHQVEEIQNSEVKRRIGTCPKHIFDEIIKLTGYQLDED
jgi:hypothetical protein